MFGSNSELRNNRNNYLITDDLRQSMKSETNRLKTYFLNDQSIWPVPGVTPADLARAGLYLLYDDKVQCAFCTGVISNWSPGMS